MNVQKELYLRGYEHFYDQLIAQGKSEEQADALSWKLMTDYAKEIIGGATVEAEIERKYNADKVDDRERKYSFKEYVVSADGAEVKFSVMIEPEGEPNAGNGTV